MLQHDVQRSGNYKYRIDEPTDVGPGDGEQPASTAAGSVFLDQNAPNPFNPTTRIEYGIPASASGAKVPVKLDIFDASGRRVRQLLNGEVGPGRHLRCGTAAMTAAFASDPGSSSTGCKRAIRR
jgi:hypothetical protein